MAAIFLAVVALAVAALTFARSYPFGFARQEWTYRQKKAYAPETPHALLRRLVFDPHELVRWAVAQRNPLPEREIRQKLLVDRSSRVRGIFAMRPDLTNAEISRLLHDPVESVRSGLAQGPTLTQSQAIHIARDSSPLVRGWATSIPVLPASELQLLLSDRDENVRRCAQSAIEMRNQSPPIPYSSCKRSSDTGIVNDIIRTALPALEIQISCSDSERTIHALRDPGANWNVQILGLHNDAWDAAAFSLAGIPARKSEETWDLLHTYPADTFASLAVTLLRVVLASKDDSPTIQALR
ncbi:MAG: hypothetical protein ACP5OR_01880 [Candidatus Dormibacteria bacterium]